MDTRGGRGHAEAEGRGAPLGLHPASTLVAWLESHVRGRRVAVLGDATVGLAEALVGRGARLVHAYDPDPARVAEATATSGRAGSPRPLFAPLEGDLGVRDGAFDVVVVPDLGLFGDAAEALRRVRRLLSPSGIAVVASRNPDAARWLLRAGATPSSSPSYYDLFDLVSLQFPEVKMLGQTPFVGYAIVDFAADEPEVTVDASLLEEPEAPEWYVAVAGDRRLDLDAYALVELPFSDIAQALAGGEPTTLRRQELAGLHEQVRHDQAEAQRVAGERQALEGRVRELEGEAARLREAVEAKSGAARDRELIAARLSDAERELSAAVARMREAEARAADTHVRAERLSTELRELDDELRRQRDRAARLNKLLDEEKRARARTPQPAIPITPAAGPESAALTIRPAGMPADDARAAAAREATLRHELDRATARIVELERKLREEAPPATLEPVTVEPATVGRDGVHQRVIEAEQRTKQLEARLAERETKLVERDGRIAERDAHIADLRGRLAAREGELAAQAGKLGKLAEREGRESDAERRLVAALAARETAEARVAALEPELAALRAQRDQLEARRSGAERSLAEARAATQRLEAQHAGRDAQLAQREAQFVEREAQFVEREAKFAKREAGFTRQEAEFAKREAELAQRAVELRAQLDAATARADEAERRASAAVTAPGDRAHEEEIDRLEAALRDRGREIARLQAELREGLRVGKELLHELEAARIIPPVAGGPNGGGGVDTAFPPPGGAGASASGARLEAAAEHAAKAQADLVGATLKIAQLENEIRRLRTSRTPDDVRRQLEEALVLAQQEIAALRDVTSRPAPAAGDAAIVEQQVLLHQVEALRDGAGRSAADSTRAGSSPASAG